MAQEKEPAPTSRDTKANQGGSERDDAGGKKKPQKKKKMDPKVYQATITDRYVKEGGKPFQVTQVVLFVPEVSLFGGAAGKESKTLVLKRGAASIEVPFAKLRAIEVGERKEDRITLNLEVEAEKPEGRKLSGTVKASLELRGTYASNGFKTTVRLRDVKRLTLALDPKAKENK
ncbi:MAG TPA: hypothetical protein DEA08_39380 [Planctomycetes bacterium]|nr:hypothetical protein [Planctomycetota bacterium]